MTYKVGDIVVVLKADANCAEVQAPWIGPLLGVEDPILYHIPYAVELPDRYRRMVNVHTTHWWVAEIRLATPEEVAQYRLESGQAL